MNAHKGKERFLFITPYLTEVQRIIDECPDKIFCQPKTGKAKLRSLKILLESRRNIATTHALFHYFDQETIDLIKNNNYILVMDEVVDVVLPYEKRTSDERVEGITRSDLNCILKNFAHLDSDSHLVVWDDDTYYGGLSKYRRMCELGCLAVYGAGQMPLWLFPVDVFTAFSDVYVMTYMFEAQIQKYYYDMKNIEYEYLYVDMDANGDYFITKNKPDIKLKDYRSLIKICEKEKLNRIGDKQHDLSKAWYVRNQDNCLMGQLKNNVGNFFKNICVAKSERCLWTTFKSYKSKIRGKGYTKGFIPCNLRATNEFRDRDCFAYLMNKYLNPFVKNFFAQNGVSIDEDKHSLSELLQCLWRTCIRDDKPIHVFIAPSRMRKLLKQWIEENSPK